MFYTVSRSELKLLKKFFLHKMAPTEDQVNMSGRSGEYGEQPKEIRSP